MEVLSFRYDAGEEAGVSVVHEPLSKIGSTFQGRCRIYIQFMQEQKRLPCFGLVSINLKNIRDISIGRLMHHYEKISVSHTLLDQLIARGAVASEFLIMECLYLANPFRICMMAADRTFSEWTPWFQSAVPLFARLLVDIPKEKCRIYNASNFNLYLYEFLNIGRRSPLSCEICFELCSNFTAYSCGHGMCTSCETQKDVHSKKDSTECSFCNTKKKWKVSVCLREGACPIDNCQTDSGDYVLFPCGCIISHDFQRDEYSIIGGECPYDLCRKPVEKFTKIYMRNDANTTYD